MKKMNKMNKRIVVLLTALLLMVGSMKAQVFIADDEFEGMMRQEEPEYVLFVLGQGHDGDQFMPVGNGVLLLVGLGGAYLLSKRKKQK